MILTCYASFHLEHDKKSSVIMWALTSSLESLYIVFGSTSSCLDEDCRLGELLNPQRSWSISRTYSGQLQSPQNSFQFYQGFPNLQTKKITNHVDPGLINPMVV